MAARGAERKLLFEPNCFRFLPPNRSYTTKPEKTESGSDVTAAGAALGDGDRDGPSSLGILQDRSGISFEIAEPPLPLFTQRRIEVALMPLGD
jgi:hypothetical protein